MVEKKKPVKANKTTSKKATVRKATAGTRKKKTAVKKIAVEKTLNATEIEAFRQQLLAMRRDLLGDMGQMQSGALDHDSGSGELSTMPVHMADVGSDNYEQEFALGLVDTERKILTDIDRALTKIGEGTYGICEGTGEPIGRSRLEANPYARYCIDYARKIEKGLVKPEYKFGTSD